ncbi:helix-turn-helix domain-containing protein [Cardinium endosymbiont of Culicoides punctatus]|uniref:helix-turn-helix domain-containing protein n=1 Tax=Cardinium endosymbiont of Culicoides punctatus TaxID=2304601 RepID=UPI0014048293|nr:helix-turn-helix domain-containing protein [Cardinium endosymbiont of Culicoides punctatus]
MENHKGKIVQAAIKKSGYQITALAEKLGIARNTLYTKLKDAKLDDGFIIKVSNAIHYDFSSDFPHLNNKCDTSSTGIITYNVKGAYRNPDFVELQALNKKYLTLIEEYNKLFKILILLANNNDLIGIKKEIAEFMEEEEKERNA